MCFVKTPQIGGNLKCFAAIRKCANERLLCKLKSANEYVFIQIFYDIRFKEKVHS